MEKKHVAIECASRRFGYEINPAFCCDNGGGGGVDRGPVSADHATPGSVAATVTPGLVSVSVSKASVGYGQLVLSTSTALNFAEPTAQTCDQPGPVRSFFATNTGNINAELRIRGENSFETETGPITVFNDLGGGVTQVTSTGHPLSNGDAVTITDTTTYNGTFTIAGVAAGSFNIIHTGNTAETTGNWTHNLASGSTGAGWDLNVSPAAVQGGAGNEYSHLYTTHGGLVTSDPTACDFAGLDPNQVSGLSITAFLDGNAAGPNTQIPNTTIATSATHGLVDGDRVNITSGVSPYNGIFVVSLVGVGTPADNFRIAVSFISDGTGTFDLLDDVLTDGPLDVASLSPLAPVVVPTGTVDVFLLVAMRLTPPRALTRRPCPWWWWPRFHSRTIHLTLARIHRRTRMDGVRTAEGGG